MTDDHKSSVREAIRNFILGSITMTNLKDDEDLFEAGIVNSLFAIRLMTFLEKSFQIEVESDDLVMENFKSVQAASEFVLRKANPVIR